MTPKEMIQDIVKSWFLREPAFYALFCLQELQENVQMECDIRAGEGRIEYNPLRLARKNLKEVELLLRIEHIRLFLKHPYERKPEGCSGEAIALGSDCTIADGYALLKEGGALKGPGAYHLPIGQCYEWYCKELQNKEDKGDDNQNDSPNAHNNQTEDGGGNSEQRQRERQEKSTQSALWHDDALKKAQINDLIERTSDWGSLPGDIVEQIQASTRARLNRSMVFEGFRSNLLSSHRILTRMRPNRRTGFLQMGSKREVVARLLIAIDCSGSIDEEDLKRFFSIVNRLFLDREISIYIMQFDAKVQDIRPMNQAMSHNEIKGRGGTDFQPVIDSFLSQSKQYDGLMIFTDGEARPPQVQTHHSPILWVCKDEQCYKQHRKWMEKIGRCVY